MYYLSYINYVISYAFQLSHQAWCAFLYTGPPSDEILRMDMSLLVLLGS